MNDEIKQEILMMYDLAGDKDLIYYEAIQRIIDYIADLQQENEELNKENEKWWAIIKDNEQEIKDLCLENSKLEQENKDLKESNHNWQRKLSDYKSRIEKAVDYIKQNCIASDKWEDLGFCNFVPTGEITYKQLNKSKIIRLLNILNGKE